jgi:hypothetical protein
MGPNLMRKERAMSHLRVLICRVDDNDSDRMMELASFDMPEVDVTTLDGETALDDLEATTNEVGHEILRRLLQAQWEAVDEELAGQYRQRFSP